MGQTHNWMNFRFNTTEKWRKEKQRKRKGGEAEFGEPAVSQAGVAVNLLSFSVSLVEAI